MKSSYQTSTQSRGTERVVSRIFKDSITRPLWRKSGEVAMVVVQRGERRDRGKFEKEVALLAVEIATDTGDNKVAREDESNDHLASEDEAKDDFRVNLAVETMEGENPIFLTKAVGQRKTPSLVAYTKNENKLGRLPNAKML
ncbi:hypothetical protein SUGI_1136990 [Cryptomeria japonica]|nr:hypothetical protein SUGI_1136990 [Cryptomeria japonica]